MGILTDIFKEIPLSAVLRERLLSQEIKMTDLEAENAALKTDLAKSQKENEELRSKIKQYKEVPNQRQTKAKTDFDVFNH